MAKVEYKAPESLDRLLMSGEMEKRVQGMVRSVLAKVRAQVSRSAQAALPRDPRAAYKAVKMMVYRQVLGGNVSILNKRRGAVQKKLVEPVRRLRDGQRGGNRMKRSQRTEDLLSYYGPDRAFVLRFLNSGTAQRTDARRNGNRGSIAARGWFANLSQPQAERAAQMLGELIEAELEKAEQ